MLKKVFLRPFSFFPFCYKQTLPLDVHGYAFGYPKSRHNALIWLSLLILILFSYPQTEIINLPPKNLKKSEEIALVLLQILAKYVMIMVYMYI